MPTKIFTMFGQTIKNKKIIQQQKLSKKNSAMAGVFTLFGSNCFPHPVYFSKHFNNFLRTITHSRSRRKEI